MRAMSSGRRERSVTSANRSSTRWHYPRSRARWRRRSKWQCRIGLRQGGESFTPSPIMMTLRGPRPFSLRTNAALSWQHFGVDGVDADPSGDASQSCGCRRSSSRPCRYRARSAHGGFRLLAQRVMNADDWAASLARDTKAGTGANTRAGAIRQTCVLFALRHAASPRPRRRSVRCR